VQGARFSAHLIAVLYQFPSRFLGVIPQRHQ